MASVANQRRAEEMNREESGTLGVGAGEYVQLCDGGVPYLRVAHHILARLGQQLSVLRKNVR